MHRRLLVLLSRERCSERRRLQKARSSASRRIPECHSAGQWVCTAGAKLRSLSATSPKARKLTSSSPNRNSRSRGKRWWHSAARFDARSYRPASRPRLRTSRPPEAFHCELFREDINKLFAQVQNLGKITQHTTQREDKTTAVIDSDAKIKNLTSFRDSLSSMLAKPSATVNDLVAIQQQLMETQSQLDSETAQRKSLANDTEKIFIDFSFRVPGCKRRHFELEAHRQRFP